MKELVTVIIPASRPETLERCLKAVRDNAVPVKVLIVRAVESEAGHKPACNLNRGGHAE